MNKAPSGSTVVVDEAYLSFFARDSQSRRSKELTKIINLARQRDLSLIFVAHEARHIDLNVLSGIDTLIMKKPGPLQSSIIESSRCATDIRNVQNYLKEEVKKHEKS